MSETPIYKTRKRKKIVTVKRTGDQTEKISYTVTYKKDKLQEAIKNLDGAATFKKLVEAAVTKLRKTLSDYANQPLLQDLYTYPAKFQELAKDLKLKLNDITAESNNGPVDKNQAKTAIELRKQLDAVVSYRTQSKKIASENFGIMTAKTINNAIASWIALKTEEKECKKSSFSGNEKEKASYWEEKLQRLTGFAKELDIKRIEDVSALVTHEVQNLTTAIGDVSKSGAKKGVRNFVKAIKNARKAMKIDTEECTKYHRLGMLKLCCELMDKLNDKDVLKTLTKTDSKKKRVAMNMIIPSHEAANAGANMIMAATVIGLCGSLSVVMLLPSLLVSGLLGLMGLTTRLGAKIALKVRNRMHEKGKSGGERMLGTSSKGKRKGKTKSKQ